MDSVSEAREDLSEFLEEAELTQYDELFRKILKVTKLSQLKFVVTEDLAHIGLSKPEQRRYKKVYTKYFPNRTILKIKKLLSSNKKQDLSGNGPSSLPTEAFSGNNTKILTKHIISVDDITINKELGMGQFGVVQQGIWNTGYQRLQVAIKCLGHERMTSNSTEFLKEAAVMHGIEHPNIVRLYGVVFHLDSLMLVTELAPLRSLLECLREVSLRPNFPVPTLCEFAEQICDGMTYLENKRLIHRDLAARNILVFSKDCVKISDFGLSRALGVGKDYYQTNYNVNLKLPVAWCAPECILYLKFTSSSDVWAFGVCMWEMFTYGFQPWAAFSGQQILETIDAPNYQRLEKPDCCPEAHYSVMHECWSHDPSGRPKFKELYQKLVAIRPEQVQATSNYQKSEDGRRSIFLEYKSGQVITVLGKEPMTKSSLWYGVLPGGACGVFDPNNTKPYVKPIRSSFINHQESPPLSGRLSTSMRSCILRSDVKRHTYTGKRSIQRSMISSPQGEVKHTGHVGLDGAYFGDISFLEPAGCPPKQVVTPYKPSEDLEQMPLINPNSPSHLTGNATSTPPYPMLTQEGRQRVPNLPCDNIAMPYDNKSRVNSKKPVLKQLAVPTSSKSIMNRVKSATLRRSFKSNDAPKAEGVHEYHEISDTESNAEHIKLDNLATPDGIVIGKSCRDFSQSLLDEMETIFRTLHNSEQRVNPTHGTFESDIVVRSHTLSKLERRKAHHNNGTSTMKPMSAHDMKTLDTAVALANKITDRTMNEIDPAYGKTPNSPSDKNKFHLKLPLASNSHQQSQDLEAKELTARHDRKNFSEAARSFAHIQETITEESKMAYNSLIEQPSTSSSLLSKIAQEANGIRKHSTIPKSSLKLADAQFNSLRKLQARSAATIPAIKPGAPSNSARVEVKDETPNELPLPPRSSKPIMVEKARHVRKYPLVLEDEPPVVARPPKHNYEHGNGSGVIYQNYISCHLEASRVPAKRKNEKVQYLNLEGMDVFDGAMPSTSGTQMSTTNPFKNGAGGANPFEFFLETEDAEEGEEGEDEAAAAGGGDDGAKAQGPAKEDDYEGSLVKDCSDHVSVEDLLEFADLKPCGRQRGTESDEVRIMCKVLKDQVIPEECLEALELCNWNVHYAIKMMRVRCAMGGAADLPSCAGALQDAAGDVVKAFADIILAKKI